MNTFCSTKSLPAALTTANEAAGIAVSKRGTSVVYRDELGGCNALPLEEARNGKRVVFTNGCFDVLHVGHVKVLSEAKSFGDILVVGLNSDESVRRLKGKSRPINSFEARKTVLESLSFVDYVFGFDEDTPATLIERIKPDVLVKGGDYTIDNIVGADYVLSYGGQVKIVPMLDGFSTTRIIEALKAGK